MYVGPCMRAAGFPGHDLRHVGAAQHGGLGQVATPSWPYPRTSRRVRHRRPGWRREARYDRNPWRSRREGAGTRARRRSSTTRKRHRKTTCPGPLDHRLGDDGGDLVAMAFGQLPGVGLPAPSWTPSPAGGRGEELAGQGRAEQGLRPAHRVAHRTSLPGCPVVSHPGPGPELMRCGRPSPPGTGYRSSGRPPPRTEPVSAKKTWSRPSGERAARRWASRMAGACVSPPNMTCAMLSSWSRTAASRTG